MGIANELRYCSELDNSSSLPSFRAKYMEALKTVDIDSVKVLQIIQSLHCKAKNM